MKPLLSLIATLLIATSAAAHDFRAGDLVIDHPYTTAAPRSSAGYFTVTNTGTTPDRLLSVTSATAMASLHLSQVDDTGVATMAPVDDGIEIPAGGTLTLEPGALHVMFMDLAAPYIEGEMVKATLVFEKVGPVEVEFAVAPPGAHADHN